MKSKSPYWEGGASGKENRPPAVGKGKRRKKQSSSGPKVKKARPATSTMRGAGSEDEFEGSAEAVTRRLGFFPPPTTAAGTRRPGMLPPPRPLQPVRSIMTS